MRIEEEIKQKKFSNEFEKLAVNIIFSHSWLSSLQGKILRKFGVTATQYNILRILRGQYPNPASVNLLKERMLDKRSDASRIVERLRIKGLVKRKICPNDRRKAEVLITEIGLELLENLDKHDVELDKAFKHLSTKEAKTINDLLDKMRGNNS